MADAPAFHGYGYGSWQTPGMFSTFHGRSGEAGGRAGEFLHGGSGTVSQFGHTQSAGGVYGLGGSPTLARPQRGVGASLKPPGWSGVATPFSVVGAIGAAAAAGAKGEVGQAAKSRLQAFGAPTEPRPGYTALSTRGPLPNPANWGAPQLEQDADSQEIPASRAALFSQGHSTPAFQQPKFDMSRFMAVRNA